MNEKKTNSTGRFAFLFKPLNLDRRLGVGIVVAGNLLLVTIILFRWYRDYAALDKRFTHFTRFGQFIGVQCYTTSDLDVSEVGKPGKAVLARMSLVTPTKAEHDRVKDEWRVYLSDDTRSLLYQTRSNPGSDFCPVQDYHTAQSLWKGKAVIWEGGPIRDRTRKKVHTLAPQTQITCLDIEPLYYSLRSGRWPGGICFSGSFELPSDIVVETIFRPKDVRLPP